MATVTSPARVVLIRHADVTPPTATDQVLNAAGIARAKELRHVFANAGLTAIFTSSLVRSQQTAAPLATARNITPTVFEISPTAVVDHVNRVVAALRGLTASSVVLVVGHSNTLGPIISGLGGPTITPIGEADFDNLYVLMGRRVTRLRYGAK